MKHWCKYIHLENINRFFYNKSKITAKPECIIKIKTSLGKRYNKPGELSTFGGYRGDGGLWVAKKMLNVNITN